jgi:predicted lipoprotein with Yx(FWY)xxD motif
MHRHPTRAALLLLSATGALALTACGSSSSSTTAAANATSAAGSAKTVSVRMDARLGDILVDSSGMTLYRNDTEQGGVVKCTAGCTTAWPPLIATGTPTAGAGVGHTLGVVTRPDGTTQVTEDHWPLYRFAADKAPGDTMGDGVGGIWHVATAGAAGGTTTPAPTTPATAKPASGYGY